VNASRLERAQLWALKNLSGVLFVVLFAAFAVAKPGFASTSTLEILADQVAITGTLAVGITFVLLTAGIDLSVGTTMYVAVVVMTPVLGITDPLAAFAVCVAAGAAVGTVNGVLVGRFGIIPFIVTLATLFIGRGLGQAVTESRLVTIPDTIRAVAESGIPTPVGEIPVVVALFVVVAVAGQLVLSRTPFGRHVYAVGYDPVAARRAGIDVRRVLIAVYVIAGVCAGVAAFIAAAQQGVAQNSFASNKEFDAIAAAVLGGASLFGGRGTVFPGAVLGSLLIALVAHGLAYTGVDIYMQPIVTAGVIFAAVLLDSVRSARLARLQRRYIRVEDFATA
jgi:ribose transport system permease protein